MLRCRTKRVQMYLSFHHVQSDLRAEAAEDRLEVRGLNVSEGQDANTVGERACASILGSASIHHKHKTAS